MVISLRPRETAVVDAARMDEIWIEKGEAEAERQISAALDDLALRLAGIGDAYRAGSFDEVVEGCRAAAEIAGNVGLDRVGRVACTVAKLARGRDAVSLAANLDRLMRLGDGALTKVWDLHDRRM